MQLKARLQHSFIQIFVYIIKKMQVGSEAKSYTLITEIIAGGFDSEEQLFTATLLDLFRLILWPKKEYTETQSQD